MFRFTTAFFCILLATNLHADCAPDHRSDKRSGVFIQDFVINGTSALSAEELLTIRSRLIGACFDDDSDELKQLVKELFQNQGYYGATVKNLQLHVVDALARPKTINLEADVVEGQIYKFGQVSFIGNHAFQEPELRHGFNLRKGEIFNRSVLAAGLDGVRKLYLRNGFGDVIFVPNDTADLGNSLVNLTVTIVEGRQYHMGKLIVVGKLDDDGTAARLQTAWDISEGAVFNFSYPAGYIKHNQDLLPSSFSQNDLQIIRNCPEASVAVWLILQESALAAQPPPRALMCEASQEKKQ
jgi:outer membrane translocation and assembly module TamA